jgi:hypothetical protein
MVRWKPVAVFEDSANFKTFVKVLFYYTVKRIGEEILANDVDPEETSKLSSSELDRLIGKYLEDEFREVYEWVLIDKLKVDMLMIDNILYTLRDWKEFLGYIDLDQLKKELRLYFALRDVKGKGFMAGEKEF